MPWTQLVDALCAVIFAVAHVCNGSLGVGVCVLSLVLRLALLPLSLRIARRGFAQQRRLFALKPELDRLRQRYATDSKAQLREIAALYEKNDVQPIDTSSFFGALIQFPILGAFFAALRRGIGAGVRFLWIGDLARPSILLALGVAAITVAGFVVMPPVDPTRRVTLVPLVVTAGITVWFLASTSALFALASGAGSLVTGLQAALLRRGEREAVA
jgi:YidC/Oxa1 family membrane protein insertase